MTRARLDALAQGVKLLAGRDKTVARLRAELERRGYPAAERDAAVERLTALGYLDDARLARQRAQRELADGWAPEGAVARLLGLGLVEAVARAAVAEAAAAAGWREQEAAAALLARRGLVGAKAARLLLSRGYSEDVARALLGEG